MSHVRINRQFKVLLVAKPSEVVIDRQCNSCQLVIEIQFIMFVNKTSCVHNIWYTGISITTTEHSACLRPIPPLLAVWKTERERGFSNYRGTIEKTPDKRQALILALKQTT